MIYGVDRHLVQYFTMLSWPTFFRGHNEIARCWVIAVGHVYIWLVFSNMCKRGSFSFNEQFLGDRYRWNEAEIVNFMRAVSKGSILFGSIWKSLLNARGRRPMKASLSLWTFFLQRRFSRRCWLLGTQSNCIRAIVLFLNNCPWFQCWKLWILSCTLPVL